MRQKNAPECTKSYLNFQFFFDGDTHGPPPLGALATVELNPVYSMWNHASTLSASVRRPPGTARRGWKGREEKREVREGEGWEEGILRQSRWGIDAPEKPIAAVRNSVSPKDAIGAGLSDALAAWM
jgi:hypothetical protein